MQTPQKSLKTALYCNKAMSFREGFRMVMYNMNENVLKIFSGLCTLSGFDLVL